MKNEILKEVEKLIKEFAKVDKKDRFKKYIFYLIGQLKKIKGSKKEASQYFHYFKDSGQAPEHLSKYDENYFLKYNEPTHKVYVNSLKNLVDCFSHNYNDSICDIGCGQGFLVERLKNCGYKNVIGVDISEFAVKNKVCNEIFLIKKISDLKVIHPLPFKIITLFSILEHLKKEEIDIFLSEIKKLGPIYILCCIPTYPNALLNFWENDTTHEVLERKEWWNKKFKKIGFTPIAVSAEKFPFVEPLVFINSIKKNYSLYPSIHGIPYGSQKHQKQIYFDIPLSPSNAFTWVISELALSLKNLGCQIGIRKGYLSSSIEQSKREKLKKFMKCKNKKDIVINWSHYWKDYKPRCKGKLANFEIFAINYQFTTYNNLSFDRWLKKVIKSSSYKLPVSNFCKNVLLKIGVPEEKCFVLPHGYSPEIDIVPASSKNSEEFIFLTVTNSQDIERYGTFLLLESFCKSFSHREKVKLIIKDYGGRNSNIENFIRKHDRFNIEYIVEFMRKENLISLYKSCNAFVAPFRGEGFGMKILDALACELPVILPLFGGPTEYCSKTNCYSVKYKMVPVKNCIDMENLNLENAVWCEVDLDDLGEKMRYVFEHPSEAYNIGKEAGIKIRKEFSWEKIAKKLEFIINQTINI